MNPTFNSKPKLMWLSILHLLLLFFCTSCKKQVAGDALKTENPSLIAAANKLQIYKPQSMKDMDWNSASSDWCYSRSKQSAHFILFWAKGYGTDLPSSTNVSAQYRVDIDDLLAKVESYYTLNINTLKFATVGNNTSKLDKYKMMIFLYYQTDWLCTGLGYDDTIGAIWLSPGTCQPAGRPIAHEIGHSFQYQVSCDLGTSHGFRWGFGSGGAGGDTFWEQTANWQSLQAFPGEIFWAGGAFRDYLNNYQKHLCHEDYRYGSYFIHYYWAQKHGIDFIAKLWRSSNAYEDPIQVYQRLNGLNVNQMQDELYDAASKLATWDLDAIRSAGVSNIGSHPYKMNRMSDGSFQPDPSFCPQTTGYNVIPLNIPAAGTNIGVCFQGIANASGYNQVDASIAGWRYGYVALLKDGTRKYSRMYWKITDTARFTIPNNCDRLWFIVTGAPSKYNPHAWDNDNSNDEQWPYNLKFLNTSLSDYPLPQQPADASYTNNLSAAYDDTYFGSASIKLDVSKLTNAFQLSTSDITSKMGTSIKLYALEPNSNLNATLTTNGYGQWFNASGYVVNYSDASLKVFSEFDANNFVITMGQYPARTKKGDKYQIKQLLVYTMPSGNKVTVTFNNNLTIL